MSATITVSQLNTKIKSLLEATFMHTAVEGEVATLTYHSSGHVYFSIKDESSSIKCVMWRSTAAKMKFRLEQGMAVVVHGSVSVYTPRGEYQFIASKVEPAGQGALALAYEQLKKKLKEKGYFEAERKKPLPKMPKRIALVTAKESAALADMLKVAQRRWAMLEVTVLDTLVQGEMAAGQIARALKYADTLSVDVVVVGRGGGSIEDLWAFNEEVVADAIFAMKTPVVSAVGHEVDTLISDFVADLRAPTPSAAMEMCLPDGNEMLYTLNEYEDAYTHTMQTLLAKAKELLLRQSELLHHLSPKQKLSTLQQAFSEQEKALKQQIEYKLTQLKREPQNLVEQFEQNITFLLRKKVDNVNALLQQYTLSDPKKQSKEGWGQVTLNGKKVALSALSEGDEVSLSDANVVLDVKIHAKKSL